MTPAMCSNGSHVCTHDSDDIRAPRVASRNVTTRPLAIAGLVTGAIVWGLIWYPLRILEQHGLVGSVSTVYVYAVAMVVALALFARHLNQVRGALFTLLAMGFVAGWTNLAYVLAVIEGEVMRVLLLFYLAPLWTVIFARLLLNERQGWTGLLVVLISLAGAATMLWNPAQGWPLPSNRAEWFGLSAGMAFALSNVLIRRAASLDIRIKALAIFACVTALALVWSVAAGGTQLVPQMDIQHWMLVVIIGLVILAANLAVQYGISHTSATQAIVILLFELVVAAVGAYFLAGEAMTLNEWLGGALIVAASLLSSRLATPEAPRDLAAASDPSQPDAVLDAAGKASRSTRG